MLFFGACLLAFMVMVLLPGKEEVAQQLRPSMPNVVLEDGKAQNLVKTNCVSCHGEQLQGMSGPNLQNVGTRLDAQQTYSIIIKGKQSMPSFKGRLTEEEVAQISLWLTKKK